MKPPKKDPANKWVGVCMTPALIGQFEVDKSIVVIIDVLRATTTMCAAFDNGVRSMIPVLTKEEGFALQKEGYLVAGERNGVQVEGFDFGNSPFSFTADKVKGKDIVITTTNGTHALRTAVSHNAKEILIGSFANLNILAEYLIQQNENVVLLCAGYKNRPNLEDTIFAGAMVRRLRPRFNRYEDTALIAETLFRNANRRKRYFLRNSSHFSRLFHRLQIQKDVKYALRTDTHNVLPKLFGDQLVALGTPYAEELAKKQSKPKRKKSPSTKDKQEKVSK
ncbi:MAG TPA: 2-phosphosulfolactate phosphatase [Bacteroidetes bacterium]|nr:2-phosphosulfolactate phosphatase [Bacteroidota bacterium]